MFAGGKNDCPCVEKNTGWLWNRCWASWASLRLKIYAVSIDPDTTSILLIKTIVFNHNNANANHLKLDLPGTSHRGAGDYACITSLPFGFKAATRTGIHHETNYNPVA